MKIIKTSFKGLLVVSQKNNTDSRGNLRETFNNRVLKKKFVFEYCTTSKKNVLRGFHFQLKNIQNPKNRTHLLMPTFDHRLHQCLLHL